jgi:hypothetical protein
VAVEDEGGGGVREGEGTTAESIASGIVEAIDGREDGSRAEKGVSKIKERTRRARNDDLLFHRWSEGRNESERMSSRSLLQEARAKSTAETIEGASFPSPSLPPSALCERELIPFSLVGLALYSISQLLNTGLDKTALTTCVSMIESGVNPEGLAVSLTVSVLSLR